MQEQATANPAEAAALDAYSTVVTSVAERVLPAVASLRIGRAGRGGAGSAVVITPDGFLVTSAHVVAQGGSARASFIDGTEYDVDVVGADPLSDLAIARARGATLEPVRIGNADQLRVGQLVVAVGNPMGFSGSVTSGVVSGLGRSLATADGNGHRRFIEDVIQTDAALNPGNSGGALADSAGLVVGINTAVAGVGLGLAVPINSATRRVIGALMTEGRVRRGYLGIAGAPRPLGPRAREQWGDEPSVEVSEVVPDSPAELAGLRAGDLLIELDGRRLTGVQDVQRLMEDEIIDTRVVITLLRDGLERKLTIVPRELEG
jgi:S1-C subfamily serine protease